MSETAASREILAPYCAEPWGVDLGFGGDPVVPHAITFDMPRPYTSVGGARQILRGDCRDLSMFCDGALDWVYSAHLVEDHYYSELHVILREWRRVIRPGGLLVTNAPDQQQFKAYIAEHNQGDNLAHREQDFSLDNFRRCLDTCGPWEEVYAMPDDGRYSWYLVVRKV